MKIALLLAGQGTKVTEQVKELWLGHAETRRIIEAAEAQLKEPIQEWLTSDLSQDTWKAQLVTYIGSMCMYQLYKEKVGLYPTYVLGHSLGEITALTIAGAMTYEEGLQLVDIRGKAMKDVTEDKEHLGMMAIFASPQRVEELLDGSNHITVANYNSAKQTVIAGVKKELQEFAKQHRLEGVILGVGGAFHTDYMKDAADSVYTQLEKMTFNTDLTTQVISNKHAAAYPIERIREEIASQIVSPVKWSQSVDFVKNNGVQVIVDLSPNGMFVKMFKELDSIYAFHDEENRTALLKELKDDIEVNQHYDLYARTLGVIVSTKNNSEDQEAYDNIVMTGYNEIKSRIGSNVTDEDIRKTLSLMELILRTKEVPEVEIMEHRNKLAWKVG
ncbi:ACP S-malonyltransferase [Paenibacillus sp. N1-5-1-14]|uniref:ACP S-malonyltransferase n=1 Tax=Paenibacillus radicibacter TaxID=2972488 RepID=UPI00215953BD|nr:ACP S-malonyltransferase [Paenibacillus radicibacter]MCR8644642.1 ACP S-malonyltransferase [Paenibacillus radicibacter]